MVRSCKDRHRAEARTLARVLDAPTPAAARILLPHTLQHRTAHASASSLGASGRRLDVRFGRDERRRSTTWESSTYISHITDARIGFGAPSTAMGREGASNDSRGYDSTQSLRRNEELQQAAAPLGAQPDVEAARLLLTAAVPLALRQTGSSCRACRSGSGAVAILSRAFVGRVS